MKKPSLDLFELVQSLTMNEKRYLSIYTSISINNKLQKLYKAINKMDVYNEKVLKKQLYNFIADKEFKHVKKELYNIILVGLQNFYSNENSRLKVESLLHQSKILLEKTLINQAFKLLSKAKKIAKQNHLYHHVYEVERLFMENETNSTSLSVCLDNRLKLLSRIDSYYKLAEMESMYFVMKNIKSFISDNNKIVDANIIESELKLYTQNKLKSYPDISKLYFNNTMLIYSIYYGNPEESYYYSTQLINSLKAEEIWSDEKFDYYYRVIGNHLSILLGLRKQEEFDENFFLLDNLLQRKLSNNLGLKVREYSYSLLFYYKGIFDGYLMSDKFCSEYEDIVHRYLKMSKLLAMRAYIFVNIYIIVFNRQSTKSLYYWADMFYKYESIFSKSDSGEIRMLEILLILDIGDYDLLESRINSLLYRIVKNKSEISKGYATIIKRIKNISGSDVEPVVITNEMFSVNTLLGFEEVHHLVKKSKIISKLIKVK